MNVRSGLTGLSTSLRIAVRGLWSRRLLTLGSFLLAAAGIAAAVLGPGYSRATAQSLLITRLEATPVPYAGLSYVYRHNPTGPDHHPTAAVALSGAAKASNAVASDAWGAATLTLETVGSSSKTMGGTVRLFARTDACAHLEITGQCPTSPGQVLVADVDLVTNGLQAGDMVDVGRGRPVRVVGGYRASSRDTPFWYDLSRFASKPAVPAAPGRSPIPYRPAPFVTVARAFDGRDYASYQVVADRRLRIPVTITNADLRAAVRVMGRENRVHGREVADGRLMIQLGSGLNTVVAPIESEQATARATILPAAVSLTLVALAMLVRLLNAAAGVRAGEIALLKLRGMSGRTLWTAGLQEPLVVLVVATPVGVICGWLVSRSLTRSWLHAGVRSGLTGGSVLATALIVVAGVVASVLTLAGTLNEPLAGQLNGVSRPRRLSIAGRVLVIAVIAGAVAIGLLTITSGHASKPRESDLATPISFALGAGVLMTMATLFGARQWTRLSTGRRRISGFVASRSLSRRREDALVVLPLTTAVAVMVFAVSMVMSAAAWRESVAASEVGAQVLYPFAGTPTQAFRATRTVDPAGRSVMAAAVLSTPGKVPTLLLDTPRLTAVGEFPRSWAGAGVSTVSHQLAPRGQVPRLKGARLTMTIDNGLRGESADLFVVWQVLDPGGRLRLISVGPFAHRVGTASVPMPCTEGCTVQTVQVGGAVGLLRTLRGTVVIRHVATDATSSGILDPRHWRPGRPYSPNGTTVTVGSGGGLVLQVDTYGTPAPVSIAPSAIPDARPVIITSGLSLPRAPDAANSFLIPTPTDVQLPVEVVASSQTLPLVGTNGLLVDMSTYFAEGYADPYFGDQVYVMARSDTPPQILAALEKLGLQDNRAVRLDDVRRRLDNDAYALALRLYLVVAVSVVGLAIAGVGANVGLQLPARRRDAAALRVTGVRKRAIVSAAFLENLVVLLTAALAGVVAGVLAQKGVVRTVQLAAPDATTRLPPALPSVDAGRLSLLVAAMVVGLLALSVVAAAQVVRGARGSTLRESG